MAVLPDLLRPGLEVVFCGPPGDAFWLALYETGLTAELLTPDEYERLHEFGIGLTAIRKTRDEFDVDGLRERIALAEPARLAFDGKNAARGALERDVAFGLQDEQLGGAELWVLPSTSGAARRYWDVEPWRQLALACGASGSLF